MQIDQTTKKMLATRHYLVNEVEDRSVNMQYLNAYLLSNFGIVVDKPALLNKDMVAQISDLFKLNVPKSFYSNPQDTKFFTSHELILEQLVSYFAYGSDLGRIELFKKDLPEYVVGDELKLRNFYIVSEAEAFQLLQEMTDNYCAYTRPFSLDELSDFVYLFEHGFYTGAEVKCKDNIFALLDFDGFNYYNENAMKIRYRAYVLRCRKRKEPVLLTEKDFTDVKDMKSAINFADTPVGHAFVIKSLLQGDLQVVDGKVIDPLGMLE